MNLPTDNKIDGRALAQKVITSTVRKISTLNRPIRLGIVSVDPDAATRSYLKIKQKYGAQAGVEVVVKTLPINATTQDCIGLVETMAKSEDKDTLPYYTALLVQLPLPDHIDTQAVVNSIPCGRDADVLSSDAYRQFTLGHTILPPVAAAVRHIIKTYHINILNAAITVVGAGKLVGKPVYDWLATLDIKPELIDHTTHENIRAQALRDADVIITGVGKPGIITAADITKGVIVIDAGTSEYGGGLSGDVDQDVYPLARLYTPVPGGVGPLTVAMLFANVATLAENIFTA